MTETVINSYKFNVKENRKYAKGCGKTVNYYQLSELSTTVFEKSHPMPTYV